jgi:hypothetical protein
MTNVLRIQTAAVFRPLLQPARYLGAWSGTGSGKSNFFGDGCRTQLKVPGALRRAAKASTPPIECNARRTWEVRPMSCEPVWMLFLNTLERTTRRGGGWSGWSGWSGLSECTGCQGQSKGRYDEDPHDEHGASPLCTTFESLILLARNCYLRTPSGGPSPWIKYGSRVPPKPRAKPVATVVDIDPQARAVLVARSAYQWPAGSYWTRTILDSQFSV